MNEFKFFGKTLEKPEIIESEKGYKYCYVLLEVKRPYKSNDSDIVTDRFKIACFRSLADDVCESVKKGMDIIITGRISANNLEKDDGNIYYRPEFIGEKIYCLQ